MAPPYRLSQRHKTRRPVRHRVYRTVLNVRPPALKRQHVLGLSVHVKYGKSMGPLLISRQLAGHCVHVRKCNGFAHAIVQLLWSCMQQLTCTAGVNTCNLCKK